MKKILHVLCITIGLSNLGFAQDEFITVWDLAQSGPAGNNSISFKTTNSGIINYSWQELPSGASGSGALWAGVDEIRNIIGLPVNATIELSIEPTNLEHFGVLLGNHLRLLEVTQWGTAQWTSMERSFEFAENMNVTATDIPNLTGVSSMRFMFRDCSSLTGPSNINLWNTGNVTDMSHLFRNATQFNQPIGDWNTANVTNMRDMFHAAWGFNQPVGDWNTAAVTDMAYMFYNAYGFNQPIGNWNTAAVTNMEYMFHWVVFNQPIGDWITANVTNMSYMFAGATSFNQPIGNWNTGNVTNMERMFYDATSFNQPIGDWNTANVTNMNSMFTGASSFNQPIGNWNTENVTNMSFMFDGATSFDQPIGDWNTANVTTMSDMLNGATSFNQPVGDWNTANVTNMNYMFGNASSFNQSIGDWTLNSSVSMLFMLDNSGMDCENYSTTLMEWAANNPNVQNRSLGAVGRTYGTNAVTARNTLVNDRGWTITGDIAGTGVCGASVTCEATATNNGDNTISASTGVSYQWIDCNNGNAPIAGATAQTFTATQTGSYAVIVTDTDNCESTSACVSITITTVGIENSSLNSLSIYPNPTAGIVTLSNVAVGSEIKILDISGKTIHTLIVSNEVLTVSTQNWNNGVYFVQVMNDNVVLSTKKLVVNK